jgi:hypothetical protein
MSTAADFNIDLDTTDTKAFSGAGMQGPSVPEGDYVVDLVEIERSTSKKGNDMLVIDFEVAEGDYSGKRVRAWYTLTEAAKGRIKQLQLACGETDFSQLRRSTLDGARLIISVKHEKMPQAFNSNGEPYPESISAKVHSERALDVAEPEPAPAPPPPSTKKNGAAAAARRA